MTYDHWKTTNPDDAFLGDPPEVWQDCPECGGEGGYEKHIRVYEHGCGFAHDDSEWRRCDACNGTGGMICEAYGHSYSMEAALRADGEKLRQLTGEDHGPDFLDDAAVKDADRT